jgi:hypothetical protein
MEELHAPGAGVRAMQALSPRGEIHASLALASADPTSPAISLAVLTDAGLQFSQHIVRSSTEEQAEDLASPERKVPSVTAETTKTPDAVAERSCAIGNATPPHATTALGLLQPREESLGKGAAPDSSKIGTLTAGARLERRARELGERVHGMEEELAGIHQAFVVFSNETRRNLSMLTGIVDQLVAAHQPRVGE